VFTIKASGIEITLNILTYILANEATSFTELKEHFSLNQSSLSRYLRLLSQSNYITKNKDNHYIRGEKTSRNHLNTTELSILVLLLSGISQTTKMTALFIEYSGGKMLCKATSVYEHGINMQAVGTSRIDFNENPWGLILLQSMDKAQRKMLLDIKKSMVFNAAVLLPSEQEIEQYFSFFEKEQYIDDFGKMYPNIRRIAFPYYTSEQLKGCFVVGFPVNSIPNNELSQSIKFIKQKIKELENYE
jgi:DNA-binding IclR family transcriptional regulator